MCYSVGVCTLCAVRPQRKPIVVMCYEVSFCLFNEAGRDR